jgi:predicted metal-dependent peptidase
MTATSPSLPLDRLVALGKQKLARAMEVLVRAHPFHGHIAAGWRARPDTIIDTMGVSWACGGVQLVWSPAFVERITISELAGVLLHEVHHVVLRHPFLFPQQADPPPDFDGYAALVAEEVTVNEFVSLPLPGEPLVLADFKTDCPELAPGQSTRARYMLLHDPARARRDHELRQQLAIELEQQLESLAKAPAAAMTSATALAARLPDSHAGWETFQRGGAAAALAVAVATAQAMQQHGRSLSPLLRRLIERANAALGDGVGSTPGGMLESLAGAATARLPWQTILRRLLAAGSVAEPTFSRPPRRFPDLVGVLPGSRRVPARKGILAAIDTSGSMSAAVLDEIAAELRVMSRSYDVSVVEFDAAIQRQYRLADGAAASGGAAGQPRDTADALLSMRGRGGTDFHPVFAADTLSWAADGGELSGIVCFTDGFGPAPLDPPRAPVIWILMGGVSAGAAVRSGVRVPARWGTPVYADAH